MSPGCQRAVPKLERECDHLIPRGAERSLDGRRDFVSRGTADIGRDFSSSPEPSGQRSARARQVVWRGLSTAWPV
jgi:hypothetical protein